MNQLPWGLQTGCCSRSLWELLSLKRCWTSSGCWSHLSGSCPGITKQAKDEIFSSNPHSVHVKPLWASLCGVPLPGWCRPSFRTEAATWYLASCRLAADCDGHCASAPAWSRWLSLPSAAESTPWKMQNACRTNRLKGNIYILQDGTYRCVSAGGFAATDLLAPPSFLRISSISWFLSLTSDFLVRCWFFRSCSWAIVSSIIFICLCSSCGTKDENTTHQHPLFKVRNKRFFSLLVVFSPSLVFQSQPHPSWRSAPTSWPSPGPLSADSSHNPAGSPDGSSGSRTPDWSTRTHLRLGHSGRLWLVNSQCGKKSTLILNSPLLCDLVLSFHLLLLKLSDVPHSNLLTELHKNLILHLKEKTFADILIQWHKISTLASEWTSLHADLTRFILSRRSVISLSREWIILLMSLMRGPKLANSLSSLDFSCRTPIKSNINATEG